MKKDTNIHTGHRRRLKDQIEKTDPANLSDIHMLEHLLTFTIPRADTNPIAHRLLTEFKSVDSIFEANKSALQTIDGIGEATASFIKFVPKVIYAINRSKALKNPYVGTMNSAITFINNILPQSNNEQFIVLVVNKNYTVKDYKIFNGVSHSYINFDAQELSEFLINHKAAFCILAHTHPYCSAIPSTDDNLTFKKMTPLLDSLAITLLDNLILGENDFYSGKLETLLNYSDDIDYKTLKPVKFLKENRR